MKRIQPEFIVAGIVTILLVVDCGVAIVRHLPNKTILWVIIYHSFFIILWLVLGLLARFGSLKNQTLYFGETRFDEARIVGQRLGSSKRRLRRNILLEERKSKKHPNRHDVKHTIRITDYNNFFSVSSRRERYFVSLLGISILYILIGFAMVCY